jgi:hypothetical protein
MAAEAQRMSETKRRSALKAIREAYAAFEADLAAKGHKPLRTTPAGFWGTADIDDCFALFAKIHLERATRFCDLGCGDGRIVAVASLFVDALGIEADDELVAAAVRICRSLPLGPIELRQGDYLEADWSEVDVFFMYPDQFFSLRLEKKLMAARGDLYVYNRIYLPTFLKKGQTYWVNQMPIVHYPLGARGAMTS